MKIPQNLPRFFLPASSTRLPACLLGGVLGLVVVGPVQAQNAPEELPLGGVPLPWKRLEAFYAPRAYPGKDVPVNGWYRAWQQAQRLPGFLPTKGGKRGVQSAPTWEFWGPEATDLEWAGRVNAVLVHPLQPHILYVGAAKGGVWKSQDGGETWNCLTDGLGTPFVGCLAFDPNDPETLYLGTGEEYFAVKTLGGVGIYRSTDGGHSWTLYGNNVFAGKRINALVVSPEDAKRWVVSTDAGLYLTTDGGKTFSLQLVGRATALVMRPDDPKRLFAALGSTGGANANGLYHSVDGGRSWQLVETDGLPTGNSVGRIELDICRDAPDVLYAAFASPSTSRVGQIWKTSDGGGSWSRVSVPIYSRGQAWYCLLLRVAPTQPNTLYLGDVPLFRSHDGGETWTNISPDHDDNHCLAFHPQDPQRLYLGQDGGLFVSLNQGGRWTKKNRGRGTMEYYALEPHPTEPAKLTAGAQDNGVQMRTGEGPFQIVLGSDGFWAAYHRTKPETLLAETYYAQVYRSTDSGLTWLPALNGTAELRAPWSAPLLADPVTPERFYVATYRLWRSDAEGVGGSWNIISGDLTKGNGTLSAVAISPTDPKTIYTGASDGAVFVSRNATTPAPQWLNRTLGLPNRSIGAMAVDLADPLTAYVGFSGFGVAHLWRSRDGGQTWHSITGDLPDSPLTGIVQNPRQPSQLMVSTDSGIFLTEDGGVRWQRFGSGLPSAPVSHLRANVATGYLTAATYGRGIWRIPLPALLSRVEGQVERTGWLSSAPPQKVTFTFRPDGGTPFTRPLPIASDGTFQFADIPPALYTLAVKGTRWLRKTVSLDTRLRDALSLHISLQPGDANDDNAIDIFDLATLAEAFNTTPGDSLWNSDADFNGDNQVNLYDLALLAENFNTEGDP